MSWLFNILIGIILAIFLYYIKKIPRKIARVLIIIPLLFFLVCLFVVTYGMFSSLLEGDFPLAIGLFVVFALFLAVLFKGFDLLFELFNCHLPWFHYLAQLIPSILMFIFFLGFFALIFVDTFAHNLVGPLPLWRRIVFFLIALIGIVSYGIKIGENLSHPEKI